MFNTTRRSAPSSWELSESVSYNPAGADPTVQPGAAPACAELLNCWQYDVMRMEVCRPLRCRAENRAPAPREAAPGEAGWHVAGWHGDERGAREPAQVVEDPLQAPSLPWVAGAPGKANGAPAVPAGSLTATAPSASGGSIPFGERLAELRFGLSAGRLSTNVPAPIRSEFVASRPDLGGGWGLPDPTDTAPTGRTNAGGISLSPLLIVGGAAKTFRWEFFSWDHLGSVRVVTDAAGAKVWETKYLPYGEEIGAPPASGNTHRFTSHERDGGMGLDYMKVRYYAAAAGRFLAPDPTYGAASRAVPTSWNRYTYVGGDPTNNTDPFGLWKTRMHSGWPTWYAVWYGVDPAFAHEVGTAVGAVDTNPATSPFESERTRRLFHAFGCKDRCQERALERAKAANPPSAQAQAIPVHYLGDAPAHEDYKAKVGHALSGTSPDYLSKNPEGAAKFHSYMNDWARNLAVARGEYNGRGAPPLDLIDALNRADASPRLRGDGRFDVEVGSLDQAVELQDWLSDNGYGDHEIVIEYSAWEEFDQRADAISDGSDPLGFSTMPKDCGPYAQDGTC
jgi:RHS repeat-associated protein